MSLENRTIKCPKCSQHTELAFATPRTDEQAFSTTHCRNCLELFICLTLEDGNVLVFDQASASPPQGRSPQPLCVIPRIESSTFVEMVPRHLGVFDRGTGIERGDQAPGISDEELAKAMVLDGDRLLRYPDGSRRDPKKLAAEVIGWRAVWVAQLSEAICDRLAGPPPLTFPPAVFVSYRWASAEDNQWVADLAAELRRRGYPVFFDREVPGEPNVPHLVSRIADARVFIAVLDPGYAERIGSAGVDQTYDG
jgi:hypothetical protein